MRQFTFRGLVAPVFTPFNNDAGKTLNLQAVPAYAKFLADAGVPGVLVNGTAGEGTLMDLQERKLITEAWVAACAQTKQHLMVQVGGAPLPDVIKLAKHAEEKGVDSILCLPELYHKPMTSNDLIQYLRIVAQAAPNTPLLYYHIPIFTNVNIHMGKFLNEINGKIPTFSGIKYTSTALDEGLAACKADNGKYAIFLGFDNVMTGAYALGFDSAIGVTLNMFPQHGIRILQLMKDGNVKEARNVQEELNSAFNIIARNGPSVPAMKEAMNLLTSINVGPVRDPLIPSPVNQVKQMETELKNLKFIS